jgi:hypothetical protein
MPATRTSSEHHGGDGYKCATSDAGAKLAADREKEPPFGHGVALDSLWARTRRPRHATATVITDDAGTVVTADGNRGARRERMLVRYGGEG